MRAKDLPLVFFTVLVQAAVGSFVTLAILKRGIERDLSVHLLNSLTGVSSATILILLISGLVIATRHLSRPSKSYLALNHLGSSWLSREALIGIIFFAGVISFAALELSDAEPWTRNLGAGFGALSGISLVYCISRLYMLRTVPAWNTPLTPMFFFTTTLLTGSVIVGLELAIINMMGGPSPTALRATGVLEQVGVLAMALAGLQVLGLRLSLFHSKKNPGFPSVAKHRGTLIARVVLVATGAAIFWLASIGILGPIETSIKAIAALTLGTLLMLIGEFLGRILFFSSYKRVGL